MIQSTIDVFTTIGDATHGSLVYTSGKIKCKECSGQGTCVDGRCVCGKHYKSSNGWSKDRKTIEYGIRGDCSYFVEYIPSK